MPDKIDAYVETVGEQIRWKKARPSLTEEIRAHLLDERDACLARGMDEEAAQAEAARQMGDPVLLGADLDRVHRPRPQWGLLALALVLTAAGVLLRVLLTAGMRGVSPEDQTRDVAGGLLGAAALAAGYLLDVSALGKRAAWVCLGFLAVTASCTAAICWGRPGSRTFVSFLLQTLFPLTLALLLWRLRGRGWRGVLAVVAWTGLMAVQCFLLPNLFTCLCVILSALVLGLFFAYQDWFGIGKPRGMLLAAVLGLTPIALLVWGLRERFRLVIFPELDPMGWGYYSASVRTALSGAKPLGRTDPALWLTENGWSLVPGIEGENLLTNLICSWGWLPFLAVVGAFLAFFLWMVWKTLRLRQALGRAVCLGGLVSLGVQAAFSLLQNLGLPFVDASFPLVVGNTGTVLSLFLIGLMLSALRDGSLPEPAPSRAPRRDNGPRRVRWENGELTISLRPRRQ